MVLTVNSITGDDEKYWFTVKEFAALFEYDCRNEKARVVALLDHDAYEFSQYGVIKKVGRKIYIAPVKANNFCIYDIDSNSLKVMHNAWLEEDSSFKFRNVMLSGGKLFFTGGTLETILIVDCASDSMEFIKLSEKKSDGGAQCYFAAADDNSILANTKDGKYIVEYDIKNNIKNSCKNPLGKNITGICRTDDKTFFFQPGGKIVYTEAGKGKLKSLELPKEFSKYLRSYAAGIYMGGRIWIIPFRSNMIMTYKEDEGAVCYKKYDNEKRIVYLYGGQLDEKNIWASNFLEHCVDIIDTDTGELRKIKIPEEIDGMDIIYSEKFDKCVILQESKELYTLDVFVRMV